MPERKLLPTLLIVIIPLGVATWILAAHTVGDSISHRDSVSIGFAFALLAVMASGYVLLLDNAVKEANPGLGIILVICGTMCVLFSLVLQFYIAHLGGEHTRHVTEILADNLKRGMGVNINQNEYLPGSVSAIAYLSLFIGTWMAAMGIRTGVISRRPTVPAVDVAPKTEE